MEAKDIIRIMYVVLTVTAVGIGHKLGLANELILITVAVIQIHGIINKLT